MKVNPKNVKQLFSINNTIHWGITNGLVITLIYIFLKAYNNDYVLTININYYGEAIIEAIIILLYVLTGIIKTISKSLK